LILFIFFLDFQKKFIQNKIFSLQKKFFKKINRFFMKLQIG